jgi:putative phage-type endonuclease
MAIANLHVVDDDPDIHLDWKKFRAQGIGASDASAVCRLNPWKSPMQVYLAKVGLTAYSDEYSTRAEWGHMVEGSLLDRFERETGYQVTHRVVGYAPTPPREAWMVHPQYSWHRATVDGIANSGGEPIGVVQVKSVGHHVAPHWFEDGEHVVPLYVQVQVQQEMSVAGLDMAWIPVCFWESYGTPRFHLFEVKRNDQSIAEILDREGEFWGWVQSQTPPPADGSEGTAKALRQAFAKVNRPSIELPPEALALVDAFAEAKAEESRVNALKKEAEAVTLGFATQLMTMLGDAEVGLVDGEEVIRWNLIERAGYTVEPSTYRQLKLPKKTKEKK